MTGLIQEFEFGMNWSAYSRLVGNVFGGPLAMEGLVAFFLESTFLGIWIFGWNRLSKKAHLATIWLVAAGTMLSAAFIMAANSWMQHPVGYAINHQTGQPQLTNIWALFTNPVFVWSYVHVLLASLVTGGVLMLAVSAWHLRRKQQVEAFQRAAVDLAGGAAAGGDPRPLRGQRARRRGGDLPADEDRRGRGPVEHLRQPLLVLGLPDRRRQQRPHAHADH